MCSGLYFSSVLQFYTPTVGIFEIFHLNVPSFCLGKKVSSPSFIFTCLKKVHIFFYNSLNNELLYNTHKSSIFLYHLWRLYLPTEVPFERIVAKEYGSSLYQGLTTLILCIKVPAKTKVAYEHTGVRRCKGWMSIIWTTSWERVKVCVEEERTGKQKRF